MEKTVKSGARNKSAVALRSPFRAYAFSDGKGCTLRRFCTVCFRADTVTYLCLPSSFPSVENKSIPVFTMVKRVLPVVLAAFAASVKYSRDNERHAHARNRRTNNCKIVITRKVHKFNRSVSALVKIKSFFIKVGQWFKRHAPTKRRLIQIYTALLFNANIKGIFSGGTNIIYTGGVKNICSPGLNCYSCPGAVASCPLGDLQNAGISA